MHADQLRSHRVLASLPHGRERALVLLLLLTTLGTGVVAGTLFTTTREIDRHAREVQHLREQLATRPTLHQRLDAIEHRLQAIEHRLTP